MKFIIKTKLLAIKKFLTRPLVIILFGTLIFLIVNRQPYFFQDDWYHLSVILDKSFAQILNYFNIFQNGSIDNFNFYRPLSTKLYFFLIYHIFGLNPWIYLLNNSLLFVTNSYLVYKIFTRLISKKMLNWLIFFYVFTLANFTNFSYFTIIEPLILNFFTLLTIYFYIKEKKVLTCLSFIFALTSRESALIIPLFLFSWEILIIKNNWFKILKKTKEIIFLTVSYGLTRTFIYGWPQNQDVYQLNLGFNYLDNVAKFLQWNFNITGLIKLDSLPSYLSIISLASIFIILIWKMITLAKNKPDWNLPILAITWWLIALLPVSFFVNHRDPWGLSIAPVGMALILALMISGLKPKIKWLFLSLFLINFWLGLNFYSEEHWTVLRKNIVLKTKSLVLQQCNNKQIIIPNQNGLEAQYAWYYNIGPKILCRQTNLEIIYK